LQTASDPSLVTIENEVECLRRVAGMDADILPQYVAYGKWELSWVLISEECANCENYSFGQCLRTHYTPQTFLRRMLYILSVLDCAGVVHGDLKLSNLLITADSDIVVTDFSGSAIGKRIYKEHTRFGGVQVVANEIKCLTDGFHAPEINQQRDAIVSNCDMYSVGMILREVYDQHLWSNDTDRMYVHICSVVNRLGLKTAMELMTQDVSSRPNLSLLCEALGVQLPQIPSQVCGHFSCSCTHQCYSGRRGDEYDQSILIAFCGADCYSH